MNNALRAGCGLAAAAVLLAGCSSSSPSAPKSPTVPVAVSTSSGPPLVTNSCGLLTNAQITSLASVESGGATLTGLKSSGGGIGGRELCSWRFAQAKGTVKTALAGVSISLTPPVAGEKIELQCALTEAGVTKTTPVPGVGSWAVAAARGACAQAPHFIMEISYFGQNTGNQTVATTAMATLLRTAFTGAGTGITK
jgi:hypothetical protein